MKKLFSFIAICSLSVQVQAAANFDYSEETQTGNLSIDTVDVEGEPRYQDVELELNFRTPSAGNFRVENVSDVEETEPEPVVVNKIDSSNTPMSLENATLETLVEQQKVLVVMYQYSHMLNNRNADDFAAMFTEDGTLEFRLLNGESLMVMEGREQIRAVHADRFSETGDLFITEARYFPGNPVFLELTETKARTQTFFMGTHIDHYGNRAPYVVSTGMYVDEFEKVDGKWLLKSRIVQLDM